jgi:hypothetical protein
MITTIAMQVLPQRRPQAIPTQRSSLRKALLLAVSALAVAAIAAMLLGYGLAGAATPVAAAPVLNTNAIAAPAAAEQMRLAVQALPSFPDPYPASAAVAP